jgi:uncharacterized repeat protein (TIGR01451 family)
MRSMLKVLATTVGMALLPCGVAVADTVTTTFDGFNLGTVNGQDGWKSAVPGNIPSLPNGYDQEVVANVGAPEAFGGQSLRISNAYNPAPDTSPPEYFYQTYSKPTAEPAGESQANTEYTAQFSFISTKPTEFQDRLHMDVSPDNGGGGRMSYIGLDDTPAGTDVTFFDTPEPDGAFRAYDLGTLTRNAPHTIRFWIKLNPGPDNDLVGIFIDGGGVGRCFTTWENFYRRLSQTLPISNRLLFRSSGRTGNIPSLVDGGYLFDNVATTTANGPGPAAGCGEGPSPPIVIDKTTRTRSALPGQLITYRVTVRNRGDAPVRGLRACDRAPSALRFVRSTTRLRRAADRRLCLTTRLLRPGQRRTFRATFRLRQNVTAETVTNGSSVSVDIPTGSAPSPSPPDTAVIPEPPAVIPEPRRRRVDRDSATIRVRTEAGACPAALNPRAHAAC